MKKLFFLFVPALLFAQMNLQNNTASISSTGVLKYNFIHAVGSADSISYTPVVAQNVFKKIATGAMTWRESDGLTALADSIKILTAGDYMVEMSITLSGTNANDFWRIKLFKNNVALPTSVGRFVFRTVSNGITDTRSYFWYLIGLQLNDVLSWRITNQTASRNPTITDIKIYMEMKPE